MGTCGRCGAEFGPVETMTVPLRALPNVLVAGVEGRRCPGCGDVKYGIPRMEELYAVIVRLLVQKPSRLTGAEARFLRKWLGWSGVDTAERLGFTPEHVSRWENDKVPISETADKLLRVLVRVREPVDDYAEWDARLATLAKDEAEPMAVRVQSDGSRWNAAA